MTQLITILAITPLLLTVVSAAGSCVGDRCTVDDETSLMQFLKSVKHGTDRMTGEDDVITEAYEYNDAPTPPPGCEDKGCLGSGPNCGGNTFDCEAHGWTTTAWHKSCSPQGDTCATGWKVQCAKCPASVKSVAMPPPSAGPADFVAPALPTAAPGTPPTAGPPVVMPTDAPKFIAPQFDPQAANLSSIALKSAQKNVTLLKKSLANASHIEAAVSANISDFRAKEKKAHAAFESDRSAAVTYAKKRALANITVMKAQKAMANAFYAEKGAAQGAQDHLAEENNAAAKSRYYKKELVDKQQKTEDAQEKMRVAKIAVNKAISDLAQAKKLAGHFAHLDNTHQSQQQQYIAQGQKLSQNAGLKNTMENAYIESSTKRNKSNVPPYGDVSPVGR